MSENREELTRGASVGPVDYTNYTYQVFHYDWPKVTYPLSLCCLVIMIVLLHLGQLKVKNYCKNNTKYFKGQSG